MRKLNSLPLKILLVMVVFIFRCAEDDQDSPEIEGGFLRIFLGASMEEVKAYMKSVKGLELDKYESDGKSDILTLYFKGGKYNGNPVNEWIFLFKEIQLFNASVEFVVDQENKRNFYFRLIESLSRKYGKPFNETERLIVWHLFSEDKSELVTISGLRILEESIRLNFQSVLLEKKWKKENN